jgi:hypothetical protein
MHQKQRKKFKSYRIWNFIYDLIFGAVMILLSVVGGFVFYAGCLAIINFFDGTLKEKWELILLPIAVLWLYFNLRVVFYTMHMMLRSSRKEIVKVDKVVRERVYTQRGSHSVWNAYYDKGYFELSRDESEKIHPGQKVELWFKPERNGKARRNVAIYV